MSNKKTPTVDEILGRLVSESLSDDFYQTATYDDSGLVKLENEAKSQLQSLVESLVDEVIGKDEEVDAVSWRAHENRLRNEQRERANKLLKEMFE